MRTAAALLALASALLIGQAAPARADAEVHATVRLALPAQPPLVVIQPGLQVVRDHEDEVFVHGGHYWLRRGDRWYRARAPHTEFVWVETRLVPEPVRRLPPGHYRRYHPPPPRPDKKEEKRLRKEAEKERRQEDGKDERKGHHDR